MNATGILAAVLAVLSCTVTQVRCLSFMLPPNVKKCLQEEIHKDVLVTGDYKLSGAPGHKTLLLVKDKQGNILYQKDDAQFGKFAFTTDEYTVSDSKDHILYKKDDALEGKFAFTSDDYDTFEICFTTKLPAGMRGADREVYLNVKRGVEAKSYEDIAKSEALKPMEVELRRLEDLSEAIVNDFAYMKAREEEMRDTNESTNSRVLYFSIFSMVCLLSLATWQVFYLRRYFKSKKLIE